MNFGERFWGFKIISLSPQCNNLNKMSSDNVSCLDALVEMYAHTVYLKVCMPQQPSLRVQCRVRVMQVDWPPTRCQCLFIQCWQHYLADVATSVDTFDPGLACHYSVGSLILYHDSLRVGWKCLIFCKWIFSHFTQLQMAHSEVRWVLLPFQEVDKLDNTI